MRNILLVAGLALLLTQGVSYAEDSKDKAETAVKGTTQLQVQVAFNRFRGEKKVGAVAYSVPVSVGGERSDVRMGMQVPLRYEGKEFPGNIVFKSVGTWIACKAEAVGDDRFKLSCAFEQSSLYDEGTGKAGGGSSVSPPVLRSFSSDATFLLRDGQSAQHLMATDPLTGEVLKVDVKVALVK